MQLKNFHFSNDDKGIEYGKNEGIERNFFFW